MQKRIFGVGKLSRAQFNNQRTQEKSPAQKAEGLASKLTCRGRRSFKRSTAIWFQCFSFVEFNVSQSLSLIASFYHQIYQQQENCPETNLFRLAFPPVNRVSATFRALITSTRDTSIVSTASEHPRAFPKRGSASCMICDFAFTRKHTSLGRPNGKANDGHNKADL